MAAYFLFVFTAEPTRAAGCRVSSLEPIDTVGDFNLPIGTAKLAVIQARQEADYREQNLRSATAIHNRNTIVRAELLHMTVESMKAAEVIRFQTDEEIRKHQAIAVIDARIQRILDRNKLLTERIDAAQWIELSEQVALMEKRLEALSGNRQKALPEADAPETRRPDEAPADE